MSDKRLLAIDNGGSEIKVALFSLDGHEVYVATRRLPMDFPAPGHTERSANAVWRANADAIRETMEESGTRPEDVLGIGLTGYGNGICLVDENGEAVAPLIVSTDERAGALRDELRASGAERAIYPLTRQTMWAAQPACLLPWFKRDRPEVLARARWCLGVKDLIRLRLTGEVATEITEASSGCLVNLDTRDYDDAIFETLGIPELRRIMPPIVESTAVSGRVSERAAAECGLAAGTAVAGGYFDVDAAALASGVRDCETLSLIAGTWSINEHLSKTANANYDKNANTTTLSYWPGHFLVEESWATSMSNFNWFVMNLVAPDRSSIYSPAELYQECSRRVAEMDPRDSGVVFVPYLFDSATTPGAHGAFLNLTSSDTRDQMLLAVCEGVCFSTRLNVSRLERPRHGHTGARLSGGITKSPVLSQMMTDVLGIPVSTMEGTELSAQGAAMGAGVASGAFSSLDEAIDAMVRVGREFRPDPERAAVYDRKYEAYLRALDALETFHGNGGRDA